MDRISTALPLSEEDIASFEENGYLAIKGLFSLTEMESGKQAAKEMVEDQAGASGVFGRKADVIPGVFARLACNPLLVRVLCGLIGPEIEFLSAKTVFKSGRITFDSPWHQDYAYWGGATKLSVWIALEDATPENGCLKVIPESHKRFIDHANIKDVNGFVNRILDGDLDGARVVSVPMQTGNALVFHDCLLHSSYSNTSGRDRWCFIPTYRDATVPDESNVWGKTRALQST